MRGVEWSFVGCQRGKRSIAVDLKSPDARPVFEALVRWADVVHHNLRMPAAFRLGADYESVRAINPEVVYCPNLYLLKSIDPFDLASAIIAHLAVGDGPGAWAWAAATGGLWAISYVLWRKQAAPQRVRPMGRAAGPRWRIGSGEWMAWSPHGLRLTMD